MELLDAVLDEVEGLRRTDARSFLPHTLIRELREATEPAAPVAVPHSCGLDDLAGRTITHVFDSDLRRGDAVLICADGGFVVLEAEPDGDDSAYLCASNSGRPLTDYLRPRDLMTMGLMTAEQRRQAEEQERIAAAEARVQRLQRDIKVAEEALAKLKATPAPAPTTTEGSNANG